MSQETRQIMDCIRDLRAKARMLGQEALHHPARCRVTGGCYLCLLEKMQNVQRIH